MRFVPLFKFYTHLINYFKLNIYKPNSQLFRSLRSKWKIAMLEKARHALTPGPVKEYTTTPYMKGP